MYLGSSSSFSAGKGVLVQLEGLLLLVQLVQAVLLEELEVLQLGHLGQAGPAGPAVQHIHTVTPGADTYILLPGGGGEELEGPIHIHTVTLGRRGGEELKAPR